MRWLDELPTPAWVGLLIATLRAILDWKSGVSIWDNLRRIVLTYAASVGVSYLSFMALVQPNVQPTSRDIVMAAIITFFGINIVNSFRTLGDDLEKNPLQFLTTILTAWRTGKPPETKDSK